MEDEEQFQQRVKSLFYQTSNNAVGRTAEQAHYTSTVGINGKFTTHLMNSGMWRNNGLNTRVDTDRYLNGHKDWMDKIN